ncbi:hypothetical protein AF72_00675 [Xylella taiwanensis]|uniref:Uncharacterized protein n=1 Tax=Xylella taiwanensis TaxID=1444770 RepID=Z9JMN9_9GAMM|nr:hypothetical protein AF72_00675 [Xylella taiwanensis]
MFGWGPAAVDLMCADVQRIMLFTCGAWWRGSDVGTSPGLLHGVSLHIAV